MDRFSGLRPILVIILVVAAIFGVGRLAAWIYTTSVVNQALADGVFPTAEDAMLNMLRENYTSITDIDIINAGPDSHDGNQPYVWYVTAEVRAASRADGSEMGHNGCDAPGTFFFQTHEGWFHVPEGPMTSFLAGWMSEFGLAGPGQTQPSTDVTDGRPFQFCQ